MTQAEIRALVDRYVDGWQRHDIDALVDLYTSDAAIASPIFRTVHGAAGIEASYQDLFRAFGDLRIRVDDLIVDAEAPGGARVVLLLTTNAAHRGEIFGLA